MGTGNLINSVMGGGRQILGEILLGLKKVDQKQLETALAEQRRLNDRLGEILVKKGAISPQELEYALAIQNSAKPDAPILARKKLGDLLVETGKLSQAQLESALEMQNLSQKKIGEILIEMGFVTQQDLESTLKLQDTIAYSSRKQILNNLETRSAGASKAASLTLPKELEAPFSNRIRFLDAAAQKAFANAFGRDASPEELREFRPKLAFVFADKGRGTDPLPANWQIDQRKIAYQQISSYFQNIIADRISTIAGGDAVQKRFDRFGNVDVVGLTPQDLGVAIEAATMPNYDPKTAGQWFVENSPRAYFKAMFGREFASEAEADQISALINRGGKELLNRAGQVLEEAGKPFAAGRNSLIPTEAELRAMLQALRDRHLDDDFEAFKQTQWFREKLMAADAADKSHRSQMSALQQKQKLMKLIQMLENMLGSMPPQLQQLVQQLMEMVQSGGNVDLSTVEKMLQDLFEKILQAFAKLNASPSDMTEAMMAMLEAILNGQDPEIALQKIVDQKQGKAGIQKAVGDLNQLNFFYKGQVDSVSPNDPMVQMLVRGQVTIEGLEAKMKSEFQGIPIMDAMNFVQFLNKSMRGLDLEVMPYDQWVQKMVAGEEKPGEVAKEWEALYRPQAQQEESAVS